MPEQRIIDLLQRIVGSDMINRCRYCGESPGSRHDDDCIYIKAKEILDNP